MRRLLLSAVVSGVAALATLSAQTPQFRSRVDVVIVDAVVLDDKGAPVSTLGASGFVITAGGRARKVISAEYTSVETTRAGGALPPSTPTVVAALVPAPASNITTRTSRSFLIVADVNSLKPDTSHLVLDRIATFVDGLGPDDRVGLAVLPGGTPRVELTLDHARVRDAARTIAGASDVGRTSIMTPGEAVPIARGDRSAVENYLNRIGAQLIDPKGECRRGATGYVMSTMRPGGRTLSPRLDISECITQASVALDRYRVKSRAVLQTMGALATALSPIAGPKTLVLVSDGLTIDGQNTDDLRAFARAAEAARVTLYALQPPAMLMDASGGGGPMMDARVADRESGLDGLATAALAARGSAFGLSGTADNALKQIERETSGYYTLAFERDAQDKDDESMKVDVKTTRAGYDVRARAIVTPTPAAGAAPWNVRDARAAIGQLLRFPVAVSELPVNVDVYVTHRDRSSTTALTLIAAEIGATDELTALGYEVSNAKGEVVQDAFESAPKTTGHGDSRRYFAAVSLPPGDYTLTLAALGANGRAGSLSQHFVVDSAATSSLRVGDLIFADDSAGALMPLARTGGTFIALVDVLPGSDTDVTTLKGRVIVTDTAGKTVMSGDAPLRPAADNSRYNITATLNTSALAAGNYIMRIQLLKGVDIVTERSRQFRKD